MRNKKPGTVTGLSRQLSENGESGNCPRFSRDWPVLAVYSAAALSAFFFQQYAVQLSQTIPGAVVNVKSIGMLYLPIVVLVQSLTLTERPKPMTLAAGISAIVLSILLVRSLV
jgi:hypothetical protein